MTTTELDIDLLTPLAAYLRLRETGRASFLLESVDQGRLGRYSLVGCGDRIVSFEEAESVFFDEKAREYFDPDHSDEEGRFLLVGRSYRLRMLLVCHCYREDERVIRIISARRATRAERSAYMRGRE